MRSWRVRGPCEQGFALSAVIFFSAWRPRPFLWTPTSATSPLRLPCSLSDPPRSQRVRPSPWRRRSPQGPSRPTPRTPVGGASSRPVRGPCPGQTAPRSCVLCARKSRRIKKQSASSSRRAPMVVCAPPTDYAARGLTCPAETFCIVDVLLLLRDRRAPREDSGEDCQPMPIALTTPEEGASLSSLR